MFMQKPQLQATSLSVHGENRLDPGGQGATPNPLLFPNPGARKGASVWRRGLYWCSLQASQGWLCHHLAGGTPSFQGLESKGHQFHKSTAASDTTGKTIS